MRPATRVALTDRPAVRAATQRAHRWPSDEFGARTPVAGPPLREIVRPGQTVAISMCDGTRAQPRHLMIPAVLGEIEGIVDRDEERGQPPGEPGELPRRRSVPARPDAGNVRGADARRLRIGPRDSCHLRNGLGVWREPRELIARVGDYVELPSSAACCGAAGTDAILRRNDSACILGRDLDEIPRPTSTSSPWSTPAATAGSSRALGDASSGPASFTWPSCWPPSADGSRALAPAARSEQPGADAPAWARSGSQEDRQGNRE